MIKNVYIRVNGRGNAWPVYLGEKSSFYGNGYEDYSNAAYSIIGTRTDAVKKEDIEWELLVDAGHGTMQYLLKHENRIPETVVLTHPHHDHTLSLDWVVQSYVKNSNKKYPVYATRECWKMVLNTTPLLNGLIEFKELKPGEVRDIDEIEGLSVMALPVFHGESARGASMLCFEFMQVNHNKKAVFSGDVLCPLFREKDYHHIADANVFYVDANNRFPYPKSNHWSFTGNYPDKNEPSGFLVKWKEKSFLSYLISPHMVPEYDEIIHGYFDEFLSQNNSSFLIPMSILEFLSYGSIENTMLIHYSGEYDFLHYKEDRLTEQELKKWATQQSEICHVKTNVNVPQVGNLFKLYRA